MDRTELLLQRMDVLEPVWYLAVALTILCTLFLLPRYREKPKGSLLRVLPWCIISVMLVSTAILHVAFWS